MRWGFYLWGAAQEYGKLREWQTELLSHLGDEPSMRISVGLAGSARLREGWSVRRVDGRTVVFLRADADPVEQARAAAKGARSIQT